MTTPQTVLITGSATGMGFATAKSLAQLGHTVFATMREPDGRNAGPAAALRDAAASAPGKLTVLELDVTSDQSVARAFAQVFEHGPIDVVINNAAVGTLYQLEAFTPEQLQRAFDVNVVGMQRINRAVLPHMRQRGSGLLIQVSSIGGRIVLPFTGPYTGTKHAIEALCEIYRYELASSGVDVVIVEPGAFLTAFADKALVPDDQATLSSYGPNAEIAKAFWAPMLNAPAETGPSLQLIADAIANVIATPAGQRAPRVVVDAMTAPMIEAINEFLKNMQAQLVAGIQMTELFTLKVKS